MHKHRYEVGMHAGSSLALSLDDYFSNLSKLSKQTTGMVQIAGSMDYMTKIVTILARSDFKKVFVEILIHFSQRFSVHQKHPNVDNERLNKFLKQIDAWIEFLETGQIHAIVEQMIKQSPLLGVFLERHFSSHDSTVESSAMYQSWIRQGSKVHHQHLIFIDEQFRPVRSLIAFVLGMLRQYRTHSTYQVGADGFYHQTIGDEDGKLFFVSLDMSQKKTLNYFPEVSLVNQKLLVYFYEWDFDQANIETKLVNKPLDFSMMYC